ncbi:MAG: lipocalin family protein, partial [Kaistella sp.]
ENYKYALVAGNSLDYLWILSREKTIPENIKQRFLEKAKSLGYNTSNLIWVKHD